MRAVLHRAGLMLLLLLLSCFLPFTRRGLAAPPAESSALTPLHIHPANAFQDEPFTFSVEPAPAGHVIRFTLDGSEPTWGRGQIYQGPVKVARTRVVRAAAFAQGRRTSILATQTYLFLNDVLRQPESPAGLPSGPEAWNDFPSAYQMDSRVVDDPAYRGILKEALRSLPSLSVVCSVADLFGSAAGLYLNTSEMCISI